MADTYIIYPIAKKLIPNGSIDLLSDTIKVALLTGYTYDSTHDYWDDVSSYEITPTGTYPAGGVAITSKSIDLDTDDEEGYFDGTDTTMGSSMTASFQQIVIYKDTGVAGTSPLIACVAKESEVSLSSQGCSIQWNTDGIMRFL